MKTQLFLLIVPLAVGCGQSVAGSGHLQTKSVTVTGARIVKLSGTGELQVSQGATESLTVTTDDNLLPLLETRLQGEVLELGQKPNVNLKPSHSVVYKLCLKDLKSLELSGAGRVQVTDLRGQDFGLIGSGAGEVQLNHVHLAQFTANLGGAINVEATGEAGNQTVQCTGVGHFDGKGLAGDAVTVTIGGTGAAAVNASETLDAKVTGTGSVTYFGKPVVTKSVTGVGSVNPG